MPVAGPLRLGGKVSLWRSAWSAMKGLGKRLFSRQGARVAACETARSGSGEFSIIWRGYPEGMPKPKGPFRLLEGEEYRRARAAADAANESLKRKYPELRRYDIHQW